MSDELPLVAALGLPAGEAAALFGERAELAERYTAWLAGPGIDWGLIGPAEGTRLWSRHLVNSVSLATLIPAGARLIDVGSGAGLPGIPLALARVDCPVVLLEPLQRRCRFLEQVVADLGLGDQVSVVRGRSEEMTAAADVVTARAVKPLAELIELTHQLWPAGQLLALKGAKAAGEIEAAAEVLSRLDLVAELLYPVALPGVEPATVVRVFPRFARSTFTTPHNPKSLRLLG